MSDVRVLVLGAGGQGMAVTDIIKKVKGYQVIGFLDNNRQLHGEIINDSPVLGDTTYLTSNRSSFDVAIVAIGDNLSRKHYYNYLKELEIPLVNAIHPKAIISSQARIGSGIYIGAGSVIGPNVSIKDNTIINCNSTIPHNNVISKHVNICPGVHMGGGTTIGECCFVGIGSSLIQYISIGEYTTIGAGAVVLSNLPDSVLAVGVPAKIKKEVTQDNY